MRINSISPYWSYLIEFSFRTSQKNKKNMASSPKASKPRDLQESIAKIENQIAMHGPGPHTGKQKEDLNTLNILLQKAKQQAAMMSAGSSSSRGGQAYSGPPSASGVLDKRRIQELVKEVDPMEQLDDDVEEMLLHIADDFIDSIVGSACQAAKHRKSQTLEAKDVQLQLEHQWNMWVPGFGSDELRPYKKAATTEAHKQRMALIRKTLKKY
ncbi:unnamed protein product [Owenia fusiformis]|uniref:Transcription initiation factor TFIID subunit 12 n=1 Tax=Owenia fusiformis TaxID=6347 RepID=A0A8J1TCC6_OWEFU|nr:unnamed protein product [Owenia fusiformis]